MTHNGQKGDFNDLNIAAPFFRELFTEFKRVIKDEGGIYFFCDWRGYAFYYPIFDNVLGAKNLLVWDKLSGVGDYYPYAHELVIFHRNKPFYGAYGKTRTSNIIKDVRAFTNGAKKTNGEKVHPTQKTIEIIEKFIIDSTNPGALVLDCFLGSGTTAIACIKTGRQYIGFEINEQYFDIANERIKTFRG